jgi:hypothetical protein
MADHDRRLLTVECLLGRPEKKYGLGGPAVRRVTLYSRAHACDRSREASPPFG